MASMTKVKQTVFTVPNSLHRRMWKLCKAKKVRPHGEVTRALEEYLEREEPIIKALKEVKK